MSSLLKSHRDNNVKDEYFAQAHRKLKQVQVHNQLNTSRSLPQIKRVIDPKNLNKIHASSGFLLRKDGDMRRSQATIPYISREDGNAHILQHNSPKTQNFIKSVSPFDRRHQTIQHQADAYKPVYWKGKSSGFSNTGLYLGMYQDNSLNKKRVEKMKIENQQKRLKEQLERSRISQIMLEARVEKIQRQKEYLGLQRLDTRQFLGYDEDTTAQMLKEVEMQQKTQLAAYIIQAGWKMYLHAKSIQKETERQMRLLIRVQRKWRRVLLRIRIQRKMEKAVILIQKVYRGHLVRKNLVNFMTAKVNKNLELVDNIRLRAFAQTAEKIAGMWREKFLQIKAERKQNAYKAFFILAMKKYKKLKQEREKNKIPNYMKGLYGKTNALKNPHRVSIDKSQDKPSQDNSATITDKLSVPQKFSFLKLQKMGDQKIAKSSVKGQKVGSPDEAQNIEIEKIQEPALSTMKSHRPGETLLKISIKEDSNESMKPQSVQVHKKQEKSSQSNKIGSISKAALESQNSRNQLFTPSDDTEMKEIKKTLEAKLYKELANIDQDKDKKQVSKQMVKEVHTEIKKMQLKRNEKETRAKGQEVLQQLYEQNQKQRLEYEATPGEYNYGNVLITVEDDESERQTPDLHSEDEQQKVPEYLPQLPKPQENSLVVSMHQKSSKKQPSQKKKKHKKRVEETVLNLEAEPAKNQHEFDRIFNVLTSEDRISEQHSHEEVTQINEQKSTIKSTKKKHVSRKEPELIYNSQKLEKIQKVAAQELYGRHNIFPEAVQEHVFEKKRKK